MIKQELYRIKGIRNNDSFSIAEKDFAYKIHNFDLYADGDFLNIKSAKGYSFSGVTGIPSNLDVLNHIICEDDLVVFAKQKGNTAASTSIIFNQSLGFTDNYVHLKEVVKTKTESSISSSNPLNVSTVSSTLNRGDMCYIYKIALNTLSNNKYTTTLLYSGYLNFNNDYPIKSVYNNINSNLRYVYFTDGLNPIRVINIKKIYTGENPDCFDFRPKLKGKEKVEIVKNQNVQGSFSAGSIQYMFTYIKEDLSETNIAWVSPLLYTSFGTRAGSPDESVQCSFTLNISNLDTSYDYIRLYSVYRSLTSDVAKMIEDVKIDKSTLSYCDTNTVGHNIESYSLLYKNKYNLSAKSLSIKADTLFAGNVKELNKNEHISENIIGGRNLVKESKSFTFKKDAGNYNHVKLCDLEIGCDYTVSIESSVLDEGTATQYTVLLYNYSTSKGGENKKFDITTNKVSYTFKNVQYPNLLLYQGPSGATSNNKITWTKIKVEKGTIATPWYPAVEDGPSDLWDNTQTTKFSIGEKKRENFDFYKGNDTCPLTFKLRQPYVLGVQFQTKEGVWEEPITSGLGGTWIPSYPFSYVTQPIVSIDKSAFDKYIAVRPLIQRVTKNKRNWLMQGVVNPTVSNHNATIDVNYTPQVQSSWFYRGKYDSIQNKHGNYLYNARDRFGEEVQGVPIDVNGTTGPGDDVTLGFDLTGDSLDVVNYTEKASGTCQTAFKVRKDILTFNTLNTDLDYKIDSNSKLAKVYDNLVDGSFYSTECVMETVGINTFRSGFNCYNNSPSGFWYYDAIVDEKEGADNIEIYEKFDKEYGTLMYWKVYPWQRSIINNDCRRPDGQQPSSKIKTKRCFQKTTLGKGVVNDLTISNGSFKIKEGVLFNQETLSMVKINGLTYFGNIDTLLNPGSKYLFNMLWTAYMYNNDPLGGSTNTGTFSNGNNSIQGDTWLYWRGNGFYLNDYSPLATDTDKELYLANIGDYNNELRVTNEGIRMKYKSLPHYVLSVETSDNKYDGITSGIYDITKPVEHDDNKDWLVAGDAVPLALGNVLEWKYGDIFYGTTEFVRTYSFDKEDINQVINTISCPMESDINMYGRYDKNIGAPTNLSNPNNFGKYNDNYNVINDFFVYKKEENEANKNVGYSNYIVWSNNSSSLEHNMALSDMSLTSSLKCRKQGAVEDLLFYNNDLYVLQKEALNKLMFNSRVAISTDDGVPIEVANSNKVDDLIVISEIGGSIADVTLKGIFFVEEYSKDLMNFSINGMVNISKKAGYVIKDKINKMSSNLKSNKLLLVHDGYSTIYNQITEGFESIVDGDFDYCFNYDSKYQSLAKDGGKYLKINTLFDKHYYNNGEVVYICNPDFQADKVFTNIDFRTEFYDSDNNDVWNKSWTEIYGSNDYQNACSKLSFDPLRPSNLKRKFRLWKAQIPRYNRQRLRNTWLKLNLKYNHATDNMLHQTYKYDNVPLRIETTTNDGIYGKMVTLGNVYLEKGKTYIVQYYNKNENDSVYVGVIKTGVYGTTKFNNIDDSYFTSCYFTPGASGEYSIFVGAQHQSAPYFTACIWGIRMFEIDTKLLESYKPEEHSVTKLISNYTGINGNSTIQNSMSLEKNTPYIIYLDAYGANQTITLNCSSFKQNNIEVALDNKANMYVIHVETKDMITSNNITISGNCTIRSLGIEKDPCYTNNKFIHHDLVLIYMI